MIKVGLTGNIGSGKTVVSNIFKVLRVPVYNADERGGIMMEEPDTISRITELYGDEIIDEQGKPDKKKIAAIVFKDKAKLDQLNHIMHPLVIADFEKWVIENSTSDYVIMESAILFETGYHNLFDKIIFISAPESLRLKRVVERDNTMTSQVKNRMKQQLSEKEKINKADFIIQNNNKISLISQVLSIHANLH